MEESAPLITSIQTSMNTWFTPTILFIFLNLMIATILFTSNLPTNHNNKQQQQSPHQKPPNYQPDSIQSKLTGSPSILHRLKSFTFHSHRSQFESSPATNQHEHHKQASENPNFVEFHDNFDFNPTRFDSDVDFVEMEDPPELDSGFLETHEEDDGFESLDEVYSKITGGNVNRTKSDTLPASGEVPVRLPAKMNKSASLKSSFSHFEEDKIVEARRPATMRERRSPAVDDVEVDSKADDFINKFKHQLKLQRLDSIIMYKDMVNRGCGK